MLVWFLLGFALIALAALIIGWLAVRGKMKAEVERLRGVETRLQNELQEARDTHSQFKLQLEATSEERNTLANSLSEMKQTRVGMEAELSQLENANAELEAELTARGSELQRTQQRLSKLQTEFSAMSKARADLEVMLTDSELAGNALRDEVRSANMQIVAYHKALDTAKESHLAEVDALRVAFDLAKKAHVAETTALTTNVSSTSANMAAKEQRIAALEHELVQWRGSSTAQAPQPVAEIAKEAEVAPPTSADEKDFGQPSLLPPDEQTETEPAPVVEEVAPAAKDLPPTEPPADAAASETEQANATPEQKRIAWLEAKRARFHWPDGVKTQIIDQPMDLTEVVGIDVAQSKLLHGEGIGTFWELANTRDDILNDVFNPAGREEVSIEDIRSRAWVMAEKTGSVGQVWGGPAYDLQR
jgi:predicted  nucleic acid-binding Zn-ribbon protein/predicted flap endonuclease-1-like 5' DNA nuclease